MFERVSMSGTGWSRTGNSRPANASAPREQFWLEICDGLQNTEGDLIAQDGGGLKQALVTGPDGRCVSLQGLNRRRYLEVRKQLCCMVPAGSPLRSPISASARTLSSRNNGMPPVFSMRKTFERLQCLVGADQRVEHSPATPVREGQFESGCNASCWPTVSVFGPAADEQQDARGRQAIDNSSINTVFPGQSNACPPGRCTAVVPRSRGTQAFDRSAYAAVARWVGGRRLGIPGWQAQNRE